MSEVLRTISDELNALQHDGLIWQNQEYTFETKVIVDLAGLWAITPLDCDYLRNLDIEFCPYCTASCGQAHIFTVDRNGPVKPRVDPFENSMLGCSPTNFIFCGLHMRMRITERLIYLMANELYSAKSKSKFDARIKSAGIEALEKELEKLEITHLKFSPKKKKNQSELYSTDMTGQLRGYELKKLFNSFNNGHEVTNDTWSKIASLEPVTDNADLTVSLWQSWNEIQKYLTRHEPFSPHELQQLNNLIVIFGDAYTRRYSAKRVTPYVHILCAHLVEVLTKHGSIGRYSQEGFEATHKFHRRIFQRASSHRGSRSNVSSILQIFQRIYRLILLRTELKIPPHHSMTFPKLYKYAKQSKT